MLIRGPFTLKWGDNVIEDVEEVDVEHEVDSEDFETVQGKTYSVDGAFKVGVTITLLATDIAAISALLPQHFVPNGQVMSTGETVNNAQGAIDIKPSSCDDELIHNNLDIISCGNPAQVSRIVNARSRFEGFEMDNKLQKVLIRFVGESESDEATMQFFKQGTINVVS